jgi:hypothetical protein
MSIIKCVDFIIQKKQLTILIINNMMTLQKYIISFREGMNIYEQVNFLKRGGRYFKRKKLKTNFSNHHINLEEN